MSSSLTVGSENTLLFALSGEGAYSAQVAIAPVPSLSSGSFSGALLSMSEIATPTHHSRIFIAKYTPVLAGEYVLSYYAATAAGETAQAVDRAIATGSGGAGSRLSIEVGSSTALLFSIRGQGVFSAEVAISRVLYASSSTYIGTVQSMTEVVMPSGHSRVFGATFTAAEAGEYIFSFYAVNAAGERVRAVQRAIAGAGGGGGGGGGGGSSSTVYGVGL